MPKFFRRASKASPPSQSPSSAAAARDLPTDPASSTKGAIRRLFVSKKNSAIGSENPQTSSAEQMKGKADHEKTHTNCSLKAITGSIISKCSMPFKSIKKATNKVAVKTAVAVSKALSAAKPSKRTKYVPIVSIDWNQDGLPAIPAFKPSKKRKTSSSSRKVASRASAAAAKGSIVAPRFSFRRALGAFRRNLHRGTKVAPTPTTAAAGSAAAEPNKKVNKNKKKTTSLPTIKLLLGKKISSVKILALSLLREIETYVANDVALRHANRAFILSIDTLIAIVKAGIPNRRPRAKKTSSTGGACWPRRSRHGAAGLAAGLRKGTEAAKARARAIVAAFSKKNKIAAIAGPAAGSAATQPHRRRVPTLATRRRLRAFAAAISNKTTKMAFNKNMGKKKAKGPAITITVTSAPGLAALCKHLHNRASVAAARMSALAAALPKGGFKKDKQWTKLADAADPATAKLFSAFEEEGEAETPTFRIQAVKLEDWVQF